MSSLATNRPKADELILMALKEDITNVDITTTSIILERRKGQAQLLCKQDGVIAGLGVFERVFELLDDAIEMQACFNDGDEVKDGDLLATITGDISTILIGERTALNYLQRMSGIATHTRKLTKILESTETRLLDTRKTTPNMRIFEKYAVKVGGGKNHRFNLSDGILIKDNHICAAGGVKQAIELVRENAPSVHKIEVEVENLNMLQEALDAGADIIMLDNMDVETMKQAVMIVDGRAITECSGNVTKERLTDIAEANVDYVSIGALTHSSPILDVSLKNLREV